jgi:hypothetical protein
MSASGGRCLLRGRYRIVERAKALKALILDALREKYPELGIEDADLIDLRAKR